MKTFLLPAFSTLVLVLATISIVRTQPHREPEPPPLAPPQADFTERVAAVGLIEASSENISLSSHLPGVVERVFVTVGQDVQAGDPLVKLDTRALEAERAERESDLQIREASVVTARARAVKARANLTDQQQVLKFAEALTEPGSISAEELSRRRNAVAIAAAEVQAADAEIGSAEASVKGAQAGLRRVETELSRSRITAPIAGRILQVRIRPGEFATAGTSAQPWLVLGNVEVLHVRVDVDEHEAWRVQPGAKAVAQVRGNSNLRVPLRFVRFEPLVIPKQSLTGASTERVDTRVLQAVYKLEPTDLPLFVGQQMDVFIDASGLKNAVVRQ
ncbi:MAG: biotin/lipoyl-binding protein [Verrucomicrobia bacterium]|nr:biotin/lipoyl-binding protein [Verrucomicrobiota bacterium]